MGPLSDRGSTPLTSTKHTKSSRFWQKVCCFFLNKPDTVISQNKGQIKMKESDLKYYKVIGKIQTCASTAESFYDAVCNSIKIVLDNSMADYAVIWYASKEEPRVLSPYYWIGPMDITSVKHPAGEGIVGKVYESGTVINSNSYTDSAKQDFPDIDVAGILCVPFAAKDTDLGCIEFVKTREKGPFSEDEAETCHLLTILAQMAIEEDAPLPDYKESKEILLSARNITKSFKNGEFITQVLKGVNFDVFEGEFLCFLGESGCGKSTVLNIVGGILEADGGTMEFKGENIVGMSNDKLTHHRRDNIGFIFQSYNLMPNLNARQNLDLIGELVKNPMDSVECLNLVGMAEKAENYPSQLSGGQQQRVSIARALVKNPKLILADEPTAALDYETSIEVLSVLEKVIKSGTTLVMVTHNEEITKMADRVIRFRNGRTYEVTVNRHPLTAKELEW